uniref:Uncharacterized protein n=1 Tax=Ditylenchus dipsaci TaxID=166011 RepID=A0A915EAX4_9BILA
MCNRSLVYQSGRGYLTMLQNSKEREWIHQERGDGSFTFVDEHNLLDLAQAAYSCDKVDDMLAKERLKKKKQQNLSKYFFSKF